MTTYSIDEVEFPSSGARCRGWRLVSQNDRLLSSAGRPIVVMAHGVGGTIDTGLQPFAERFCATGVDVVAVDYRGFGASSGAPRQSVSMRRQVEDLHAAVDVARALPGVEPNRVVLWGISLGGGHVITVASQRRDLAAVIALTPLVDGWAAAALALRHCSAASVARCAWAGLRSQLSTLRGGEPVTIPMVAPPGSDGAINLSGAFDRYTSLAGPTWCNRIDAAIGFELLRYRPTRGARRITCPTLVQIGDIDRSAPPGAAAVAAAKARASVRHYGGDHFDAWPGGPHFTEVAEQQCEFLATLFARSR
jgi:uncharacterized protein